MENVTNYLNKRFPHICFRQSWELSNEVFFKIGQCYAIVESLKYLPLAPDVRQKMLNVSLIKGAQATTAIEGNTLSEDEIEKIKNGRVLPESRKYLETEVKNIIDALNDIFKDVVHNNLAVMVTPELICALNKRVGQNLGEAFNSVPGQFRHHNVHVANYVAPDHHYVAETMDRFCRWLSEEFKFDSHQQQNFTACMLEAIVSHVYIAWIHPFGDGNGRTARLLEFYILLRGGLPNICSHILSNHYNQTRSEYYRQLETAGREGNLTKFIEYAVQGMLDGLKDVLRNAQIHQITGAWFNYIYEVLDRQRIVNRERRKRLCNLLKKIDIFTKYTPKEIVETSVDVAVSYAKKSERSIVRDLNFLVEAGMLKKEKNKFSANLQVLVERLPESRAVSEK